MEGTVNVIYLKPQSLSSSKTCRNVLKLAIPSIASLWFGYLAEVINTIFIGTLNDEVLITSLGLGNMTVNTAILSILIGLSSTLDTLIPQAYGANNLRLCGTYTQRGVLICSLAFALLVVLLNFGAPAFFRIAQQEDAVAENAQIYINNILPGMFFLALFDIIKKLPITAGKENAVMVIQMISTSLHVLLNYLFVVQFDLKVRGTAQAMSITQFVSLVILCVYSYTRKDLKESWFRPTSAVCKNVVPYIKLAAPSTVMICAAWWGFQFQFLVSSKISVTAAAVQVIMINICSFLYQIPAGISVAASILVGKAVGSQHVPQAKSYTKESLKIIALVASITSVILYAFKEQVAQIFTSDEKLVSEVAKTIPYYIVYQFFDYVQGTSSGIIRGMGKQFYASIVNIVSCFVVALPLGIYCAFTLGFGLQGLWLGMIANVILQASIYQVVIFMSNWDIIADKAKDSLKEADLSTTTIEESADLGPQ